VTRSFFVFVEQSVLPDPFFRHIATHFNTLQHKHRNTMLHIATHCRTLQLTATHYNTLQHTAAQAQQHTARHCNAVYCVALLYCPNGEEDSTRGIKSPGNLAREFFQNSWLLLRVCVLHCFINPTLGNRFGAEVSSCLQTSDNSLGWLDPHPPPSLRRWLYRDMQCFGFTPKRDASRPITKKERKTTAKPGLKLHENRGTDTDSLPNI